MRIGFDAKWVFSGNPSGKVLINNILRVLLSRDRGHEFVLFVKWSERKIPLPFPIQAPVRIVPVWSPTNLLANVFIIPFITLLMGIDVCILQSFASPISAFKRVVLIYDVIFEMYPQYFSILERIYFIPMKFLASRAHWVCTISNNERERMIRSGYCNKNNSSVVYPAADRHFKPIELQQGSRIESMRRKYALPNTFLLYVGRINVRKNIPTLLKAVGLISASRISLVLVGRPDWKSFDLKREIALHNVENKVLVLGHVIQEDLYFIYSLAKIFCYLSYDEGFGLPPLEAMASGVPVVIANTGSLPEVCGQAGTLVDIDNPADIAHKIDVLLTDATTYQTKRKTGLERAQLFSWENAAAALLEAAEKAGDGRAGS
jgi:glycosyltransferase involved in cell wall biosynthesis